MTWERDPLFAKAKLFLERAFKTDRDSPEFGLTCAFGLELLARAAISSVSPTLLAEPDRDHKNLLHALGRGASRTGAKSLGSTQVIKLCELLFVEFTPEHSTAAIALINRRNEELHSGASAFEDYSTQHWISGFYSCCKALVDSLGESMEDLLGVAEAQEAQNVLEAVAADVRTRVSEVVRSHKRVFESRTSGEQEEARKSAADTSARLAFQKHHRIQCPACGSSATVQGQTFGGQRVSHDAETAEVVVRQSVAPRTFECTACGLRLSGYSELSSAGLGAQYTRTSRYTPEEYYELINPDDWDTIREIYENSSRHEYNNE